MHTINHQPAFFSGGQICYAGNSHSARRYNILVKTLGQIKKERRESSQYRKEMFLDDDVNLGYIIVYAPD